MKKSLLTLLLFAIALVGKAQITLTSADLTHSGDLYTVSTGSSFTGMDATLTGANYIWDYSQLGYVSQTTDTIFDESATGNLLSLYYIDSQFNPNRSNQARHGNSFSAGTVNVSGVWDFYYNSNASFNEPGFGAVVNGAPLPILYTSRDIIYNFPLTYNSTNTCNYGYTIDLTAIVGLYYRVQRTRTNEVDGWGTVTTPYGTFDALRVKSTVMETDSFYLDTLGVGFATPPITTIEYKWMSPGKGIPVLQINTQVGGIVSSITYRDTVNTTSVESHTLKSEPVIFPNPSNNDVYAKVDMNQSGIYKFDIYSIDGRLISSRKISALKGEMTQQLNLGGQSLESGQYLLQVSNENGQVFSGKFNINR